MNHDDDPIEHPPGAGRPDPETPGDSHERLGVREAARLFELLDEDDLEATSEKRASAGSASAADDSSYADTADLEQLDDLPRIPGYRLEGVLGGGGGGRVFRGVRDGSDRLLAIKLLSRPLGQDKASERAHRELDLLAEIRLDCVPRLVDYGVHEGRLYIATEHVAGEDLKEHCETHELTRRDRVELLARVARAMQKLHDRGVLHRDVKPSNILIDEHSQPVVIDLGIAAAFGDDPTTTLTAEGDAIGSPAYMAPEQARGERSAISIRSDVYGLGATAYSILLGETPHKLEGSVLEAIHCVGRQRPRAPKTIDPGLDNDLAAILERSVDPDPEERYHTAEALANDLDCWLRGDLLEWTNPGAWKVMRQSMKRHRRLWLIGLSIVVLVMAGFAAVGWLKVEHTKQRLASADRMRAVQTATALQVGYERLKLLLRGYADARERGEAAPLDEAFLMAYTTSTLVGDAKSQREAFEVAWGMHGMSEELAAVDAELAELDAETINVRFATTEDVLRYLWPSISSEERSRLLAAIEGAAEQP